MIFKKNKLDFFIVIIIYVIGLSGGLFVGDIPYFSFDKSTSIDSVANLLLTLFLVFFFNDKVSNKRNEKDIIIDECKKIDQELRSLKELAENTYAKNKNRIKKETATKIILRTRHISNLLNNLDQNIAQYKKHKHIQELMSKLIANQITYWSDLTQNLRDAKPKITQQTYMKTEKNIGDYILNLSKLILFINEC